MIQSEELDSAFPAKLSGESCRSPIDKVNWKITKNCRISLRSFDNHLTITWFKLIAEHLNNGFDCFEQVSLKIEQKQIYLSLTWSSQKGAAEWSSAVMRSSNEKRWKNQWTSFNFSICKMSGCRRTKVMKLDEKPWLQIVDLPSVGDW